MFVWLINFIRRLLHMTTPNSSAYNSADNIDHVLYADTVTIPASSFSTYVSVFTPLDGQYTFPVGIYSTDGGATWADCNGFIFGSTYIGNRITCQLESDSNANARIGCSAYGGASATDVIVKFVLLAIDTPSPLSAIPSTLGTTPTAYGMTGGASYRKIILSEALTGTATTAVSTIAHGQSSVPMVASWAYGFSDNNFNPFGGTLINIGSGGGSAISGNYVMLDGTNVYACGGSGAFTNINYRVYSS